MLGAGMSRKVLAVSLLVGGVIVAVVLGRKPALVYSRSVAQFMAQPIRDQQVRVSGYLVHGSLCRIEQPCEYRFKLTDSGASRALPVRCASCLVPDGFGEVPGMDVSVVVEGELGEHGDQFEADKLFLRVSGKYEYRRLPVQPAPACPP